MLWSHLFSIVVAAMSSSLRSQSFPHQSSNQIISYYDLPIINYYCMFAEFLLLGSAYDLKTGPPQASS